MSLKSAFLTLRSQVTSGKKRWFFEGSGGTALISLHFGTGGAPCRAAVTISSLFFYCINNNEMNLQVAGGKVAASINHLQLTGSWERGTERFTPGLRERTLRNPWVGCAQSCLVMGRRGVNLTAFWRKVSYERCHPVCIKAFPVRKKNWK